MHLSNKSSTSILIIVINKKIIEIKTSLLVLVMENIYLYNFFSSHNSNKLLDSNFF